MPGMAQKTGDIRNHRESGPPGGASRDETRSFEEMLQAVGQHQDKPSFVALFEHFAPRVKSYLIKGGMKPEQADELAQETMLSIWNKADRYDPRIAAASTWIFTIARNKRTDALRRDRAAPVDFDDLPMPVDETPGPRDQLMSSEQTEIIAEALKTLPAEQAGLLYKSFFEGKSHGDIAQETGLPLGTVKSRIRLALEKLRGVEGVRELWQ